MRDLVRSREAAVKDRTGKRQEIRSFVLRHGKIYPSKQAWSTKYFRWLRDLGFAWPGQTIVLHEMIVAETQCRERVARLDQAIEDALLDWPLAPVVDRLQALRGVGLIVSVTFMVAVGDIRRFENPRRLTAWRGLVPSEHSTGDSVRRGSITKTGNARVRRMLAESAWTYRYPARVGKTKDFATRHFPEAVRETAWKAQARLTKVTLRPAPHVGCAGQFNQHPPSGASGSALELPFVEVFDHFVPGREVFPANFLSADAPLPAAFSAYIEGVATVVTANCQLARLTAPKLAATF